MQRPTLTDVLIRSTRDGQVIFEAVAQELLPLITKRLTSIERQELIRPGSVFVWEERGPESGTSGARIERWTDGKQWGPSRVRDEFLVYMERTSDDDMGSTTDQLIKQTYSVWAPTSRETRKWHLVAYFTSRAAGWLGTIDHIPSLVYLRKLPRMLFRPARTTKGRICEEIHRMILRETPSRRGRDLWSPLGSSPPRNERLPNIGFAVPPAPWRGPRWDRRLGVEFSEHRETTRELAPLIYLQSISAPPRQPLDDFAIRAFDSNGL